MEVLRCFEGGMSDEVCVLTTRLLRVTHMQMEQKRKYALWKAADLSKCLREGRTPVAGPRELSYPVLQYQLTHSGIRGGRA